MSLAVESYNSSGWRSLKARLQQTNAHILLAQEHGIAEKAKADVEEWAASKGWVAIIIPALASTTGRGISCGVAVFARDYLGLRAAPRMARQPACARARVLRAYVQVPGWAELAVTSVYFICGEGLSRDNLALCGEVGRLVDERASCMEIVGGDFNMSPVQMAEAGILQSLNMAILHGSEATCISPSTSRVLDYFWACPAAQAACQHVRADCEWHVRPHRPSCMTFQAKLASMKRLVAKTPPRTTADRGSIRANA